LAHTAFYDIAPLTTQPAGSTDQNTEMHK